MQPKSRTRRIIFAPYVDQSSKFIDKRRTNVKSDLIEITEDKLENILLKHLARLTDRRGWITPLSILIALVVAQITSTFKESLGLKADVWQAIFVISTAGALIWLTVTTARALRNLKEGSISYLISCIKDVEKDQAKEKAQEEAVMGRAVITEK